MLQILLWSGEEALAAAFLYLGFAEFYKYLSGHPTFPYV